MSPYCPSASSCSPAACEAAPLEPKCWATSVAALGQLTRETVRLEVDIGGAVFGFTLWGALSTSLIALIALALVHRAVHAEHDPVVAKVIALGFVGKLVASGVYYFVLTDVYGSGDSFRYVSAGTRIAGQLRSGDGLPEAAWDTGTPSMEFVSGVVLAATQPRALVAFFVFALLAYLGAYLALRGFSIAFPEGDRRRYATLIMLTPTMMFWPSSISKDSWLVFGLGIGIYGVARVYRRMPGGYWLAAFGAVSTYFVRPHMGTLFAVSALIGFLIRFRDPQVKRGATAWLIGLVVLSAGAGYGLANFDELLPKDEEVQGTALDQVLSATERQTSLGGSEFDSRPVETPMDLFHAIATVPFRPFPHEVANPQALLASLEGLVLLGLSLISFRRFRQLPRALLRRPFVAFATAYSLGFIVAFANVGNFGILVRQRTQLLPLFAVLLCLPAATDAIIGRLRSAGQGPGDEAARVPSPSA